MAWIARSPEAKYPVVFNRKPQRYGSATYWFWTTKEYPENFPDSTGISLPEDADEKLVGRHLTGKDEPVEI